MSLGDPMPFARGDTYFGGDTTLASTNAGINLEGKTAIVKDSATGRETTLICLRNMGTALTSAGYGAKAVPGFIDRRINGLVDAVGAYGIMVDPEYGSTPIAQYDLFWGIKSGFVQNGKVDGTGVATAAAVHWDASGTLKSGSPTAAGTMVIGKCVTAGAANSATGAFVIQDGGDYVA
jgi:hypothetical protein